MLVSLQGFGSIWEQRAGKDSSDPFRYSQNSAFYNTTGILIRGKYRHRWQVGGKLRFEGRSWFDSAVLANNMNRVFVCEEPETRFTWMQICCKRCLPKPEAPDWFLFCITSNRIGWMKLRDSAARSDETYLLSYSAAGRQQEILILMRPDSWIVGERGRFVVEPHLEKPWIARLLPTDRQGRN
jgi:hypothetical protein